MAPRLESLPSRGWLKWSSLICTGSEVSCFTTGSWSRSWNTYLLQWGKPRDRRPKNPKYNSVNEPLLTSPLDPGVSRIQKSSVSWAKLGTGVIRGEWSMGYVGLESWLKLPLSSGNRKRSERGGSRSWFLSSCAPASVRVFIKYDYVQLHQTGIYDLDPHWTNPSPFCCGPGVCCPSVSSMASLIRSCNICCSVSASRGVWDVGRLGTSVCPNKHTLGIGHVRQVRFWNCIVTMYRWLGNSVTANLCSLCGAAVLGLGFCGGQQVTVAGYVLDKVHEGGAGVWTCSNVNDVTGTSQLKSWLWLWMVMTGKKFKEKCLIFVPEKTNNSKTSTVFRQSRLLPIFHPLQVWQL